MYAVISTGGKQYRVEQGQRLLVERLGEIDSDVELKPVMLVDGDNVLACDGRTGRPIIQTHLASLSHRVIRCLAARYL